MSTPETPVHQLSRALTATGELIVGIDAGQWSQPTVCTGWTVRELLNHLVVGHLAFAAILTGKAPPERAVDHLGDDPFAAYREAAEALRAAFSQPDVLGRMVTVPIGRVRGIMALHLRIIESLVHGWDLARATGQPTTVLPEDLAETELQFTVRKLTDIPPERSPFQPPQPIADDAPAVDRLAALLGRNVNYDGPY